MIQHLTSLRVVFIILNFIFNNQQAAVPGYRDQLAVVCIHSTTQHTNI